MNRAARDARHGQTIQLIRAHRRLGLIPKPPKRPARLSRQAQPDGIRLDYFRVLKARILEPARAQVVKELLPQLPELVARAAHGRGDRFDADAGQVVNRVLEQAARITAANTRPEALHDIAAQFGRDTARFQKRQLQAQIQQAIGVDIFVGDAPLTSLLNDFASQNVALIKTLPQTYFARIESDTISAIRQGTRAEDIADQLQADYDISENRAMLIARDQIGKLNAEVNQTRQEALGIEGYFWRGMLDNRERPEHEEREGQFYSWDDPPEDGHPGEPIQCRCYAEPDFTPLLEE